MLYTTYVLGVDIGNTKTQYALVTADGDVIQILRGPGANYQMIGVEEMVGRLSVGASQLLENAFVTPEDLLSIYYGAAGADTPTDFAILKKAFKRVAPDVPFDFENDGWIALHSGTRGQAGMVITCGTGNTNFAVNSKGERMRIGGLNEQLGDVLGAYSIAAYAMQAAVRSEDGRDYPSILSEMIPKALHVETNADIINLEMNAEMVQTVVETFFRAAQKGDGRALELCWSLVKEVLNIVREFYNGLFQKEEFFRLVLDGSVFRQKYEPLTTMLELALLQKYKVDIIIPDYDPVLGAVFLALQHAGITVDISLSQRIIDTYRTVGK